jgi:hypothetical protein
VSTSMSVKPSAERASGVSLSMVSRHMAASCKEKMAYLSFLSNLSYLPYLFCLSFLSLLPYLFFLPYLSNLFCLSFLSYLCNLSFLSY